MLNGSIRIIVIHIPIDSYNLIGNKRSPCKLQQIACYLNNIHKINDALFLSCPLIAAFDHSGDNSMIQILKDFFHRRESKANVEGGLTMVNMVHTSIQFVFSCIFSFNERWLRALTCAMTIMMCFIQVLCS